MTWYRVGPAGIPGSLKTDMDAVLNKKFGTSTTYAPNTWPDNVNLLGPLPEKTASGAIANITDGADGVPLKNWLVTLPASLSGYSEVNVVRSGKNLFDTAIAETKTNNSVSITCDGNGKYTATGTATGGSANIIFTLKTPCTIKSGMYLHLMNSGASGSVAITLQKQDNTTIYAPALSPANRIADLSSYAGQTIYSIRFYIANGASFEMTLTPMLCFSNTATSYEAYSAPTQYIASLGRTIYGGQADIVTGEGESDCAKDIMTSAYLSGLGSGYIDYNATVSAMSNHPCVWVRNWKYPPNAKGFVSGGIKATCNAFQISMNNSSIISTQYRIYFDVDGKGISSVQDFIDYVENMENNGQNLEITYELETPTPFTFTPITADTELGTNNFWAEEGDSDVTYRADIDLALNA